MDTDGESVGDGLGNRERLGTVDGKLVGDTDSDGLLVGDAVISAKQKLHDLGQASLIDRPFCETEGEQ